MSETVEASEPVTGPSRAAFGDYGPVQVEMRDTLGVLALASVSLLLLRTLRKEQARTRALMERLASQKEYLPSTSNSNQP